jgi:hypothetical protein
MGPRCSSAETQVCHRSYIIAAKAERTQGECVLRANGSDTPKTQKKTNAKTNKQRTATLEYYIYVVVKKQLDVC